MTALDQIKDSQVRTSRKQPLEPLVFCILAILLFVGVPCRAGAQQYGVKLDLREPLRATVQATLVVPDGKLFTHSHAGGYEWSDFIKNLRASHGDGSKIPLQSLGPGQWAVAALKDERIDLTYDVDLTFTEKEREGAQRGGQFFGTSLYIVNRALFVMSNATGTRDIQFVVPSGFKIATPWKSVGPLQYRADNNSELADNTTVLGDFPSFDLTEGNFHLKMALPGGTGTTEALIRPVLQSALHEYIRIFPNTPEFHILLAFFHGVEINGEAYRDSGTLTSPDAIEANNRTLWANYLVHELFHHWNGNMIVGRDDQKYFGTTEWFAEGATEYIANRTLVRTGTIDRNTYLRKMETNIGMYEFWTWAAPFQGISLQDAGAKTALPMPEGTIAKTYNRPGIYSGGWVASFCLDTMIQKDTEGKKGLDDVFLLMFTRFGLTGKQWAPEDLAQSSSEVAGTDLSGFFHRYIASPNAVPVGECLADAGFDDSVLNYSGEAYVSPTSNPSNSAKEIREHLWDTAR